MPSLDALLPPAGTQLSPDDILSRFTEWTSAQGLEMYAHQEEALLALLDGQHLILSTPTGSGKTLVAHALHFAAASRGEVSVYTCPIKALVNEKFFQLCDAFGPARVGMITGDATVNKHAPILVCTAEVLMNLCLRDPKFRPGHVVMDEFHYYADKERGTAWQLPLLALEHTRFLLMSATLGDTALLANKIEEQTKRPVTRILGTERPVPLDFEYAESPLHETLERLVAAQRAPVYLVNFSQRAAAERAQDLMSAELCTKEEKEELRQLLMPHKIDTPYGKDLIRFLKHGVGVHHAGLLPRYRLLVEQLAQKGLLKVVSGTDTLGVGVNIPIRTVLFTQLCKFDGEKTAVLTVRDFLQIAGRAGRKGFDDRGTVVAQAPEHVIENLKLEAKKAAGKKIVKKTPPAKNYAHWDKQTFERLHTTLPEPLQPRFVVTHGMVLHLLQAEQDISAQDGLVVGYARLVQLLLRSHGHAGNQRLLLKQAAACVRALQKAGLVEHVRGNSYLAPHLKPSTSLQKDFSLNHTLVLWLLDALPKLDRESETYAQDVLTLVESVLENPMPVLWAQIDRAKGEKIAELKAQGMDYHARLNELDKVEHPKPLAEFVYGTFDAFAEAHPWVGRENVRPKGVARELFEKAMSFSDFVRELSIARSEGVLLRYLSDVVKTLRRSVPEHARTLELEDLTAWLEQLVRETDSSLLDEWERRMDPEAAERPLDDAALALLKAQALRKDVPTPRTTDDLLRAGKALATRARVASSRGATVPGAVPSICRASQRLGPSGTSVVRSGRRARGVRSSLPSAAKSGAHSFSSSSAVSARASGCRCASAASHSFRAMAPRS
ncbi:MAG: DUF3516 domain-containing protein, partial [Deltaproteobacteria bacterium]|nr:DUF3516 domain-containing protein [Deltaproteobacteria bacterium]